MNLNFSLRKVISGGQTGADQGGLLAAHQFGIQTGGVAPENFKTDIGPNILLEVLGLEARGTYPTRTKENVQAADATLGFTYNSTSPGMTLTKRLCSEQSKPYLEIDLNVFGNFFFELKDGRLTIEEAERIFSEHLDALYPAADQVVTFIKKHGVQVLNVAGNRELEVCLHRPFVTAATRLILIEAFNDLSDQDLLLLDSDIF